MKYKTQEQMDDRIERIIRSKVKHYYTDWKNYDRVKYMKCKGSDHSNEKRLILIARECGTYLFTMEEIENYEFAKTVYEYYMDYKSADYYELDLEKKSVVAHTPSKSWLKNAA